MISLDLSNCSLLTDGALEHLRGLPLSELDLSRSEWLTEFGIEKLRGLPLTSLNLRECPLIGLDRIRFFGCLDAMPLSRVDLSACARLGQIDDRWLMLEDITPWYCVFETGIGYLQF